MTPLTGWPCAHRSCRLRGPAVGLALGLLAAAACAATEALRTEVFTLRHRSAEALLPLLAPVLGRDAAVSGEGGTLVVRAPMADLGGIAETVRRLDAPPRRLVITVRQRTRPPPGAGVRRHTTRAAGESLHRVQVLEGESAWLEMGWRAPELDPVAAWSHGSVTAVNVGLREAAGASGVVLSPRVVGERVEMDVSAFAQEPGVQGGGRVDHALYRTTLSGPLGRWLELGGAGDAPPPQTRRSTLDVLATLRHVSIRVDDAP